jgi:hypothetical protein
MHWHPKKPSLPGGYNPKERRSRTRDQRGGGREDCGGLGYLRGSLNCTCKEWEDEHTYTSLKVRPKNVRATAHTHFTNYCFVSHIQWKSLGFTNLPEKRTYDTCKCGILQNIFYLNLNLPM